MPTTLSLANMVSPLEAWPGQQVNVSVEVTNKGNASINYLLPFFVNGAVAQSVQVQLAAGSSENLTTGFTESSDETYVVSAGGQNTQFIIVPTGYYTLNYYSSHTGLPFTLDGVSEVSPFSGLVTVGQHTLIVPATAQIEEVGHGLVTWDFNSWESGSTHPNSSWSTDVTTFKLLNYPTKYSTLTQPK